MFENQTLENSYMLVEDSIGEEAGL